MLHLIHPVLVHFTLAFVVTGGVCEAVGIFRRNPRLESFGMALVLMGTLALVPTVVAGLLAENTVSLPPGLGGDLDWHARVSFVVLGVFLVALVWKAWHRGVLPPSQRSPYALLLLLGVLLILISAYLGGDLVYGHGVGVRIA